MAIPLTVVAVRSRKERRQNFFQELLPEGPMLSRLAQRVRVAEQDVIGLLRAYGRDVAGALHIWDPDIPGEPKQPALEPLSSAGVASLLEHVLDSPRFRSDDSSSFEFLILAFNLGFIWGRWLTRRPVPPPAIRPVP